MLFKWFRNILGLADVEEYSKPLLRYADPSHDPKNRVEKRVVGKESVALNKSSFFLRKDDFKEKFSDFRKLKEITLLCIEKYGRDGGDVGTVNNDVAVLVLNNYDQSPKALSQKWIRERLSSVRKELQKQGLIGYNTKTKVWYKVGALSKNLTEKEERFLSSKGLGEGWRRIPSEIDAIKWLHQNLTPDEFENFCVSVLKTHCGVSLSVTEKRRFSGADGGFDGEGTYLIDGKMEPVALQAKRFATDSQVGEEHCARFVGALIKNGWRHGFMITTGTFSKRLIESISKYQRQNIWIELVDQNRLAHIMLTKTTEQHGFGLHKTDLGLVYINEGILIKSSK